MADPPLSLLPRIRTDEPDTQAITDHVLNQLPDFDSPQKAEYLEYVICGAKPAEAASMVGVRLGTVTSWQARDSLFHRYSVKLLPELRRTLSNDLIRAHFTRNMLMALKIDQTVLTTAKKHPESLTEEQWGYLKSVRRLYSAESMAAMARATESGEAHVADAGSRIRITVEVDGEEVNNLVAVQAGARKLLEGFTTHRGNRADIIDVEVTSGS